MGQSPMFFSEMKTLERSGWIKKFFFRVYGFGWPNLIYVVFHTC